MRYKVLAQSGIDERVFTLEDENGDKFQVDFYTDGAFTPPQGVDATEESWRAWLSTFVGKTLELERITPATYFSSGAQKLIDN
jgi:hypothetical protein